MDSFYWLGYAYVWGGPTALMGMLCELYPQAPELGPLYPIVDGGLRPVCRPRSTVYFVSSLAFGCDLFLVQCFALKPTNP